MKVANKLKGRAYPKALIKLVRLSLGNCIDLLISANIKNWEGKEQLINGTLAINKVNRELYESYQANKVRNKMITKIDYMLLKKPGFHFRNYHNY